MKSAPYRALFLFYLIPNTYKKVENYLLFLFGNIKNNSIFATALRANYRNIVGEILKRPTRTDCKSVGKPSQVRILLSPQKKKLTITVSFFYYTYFSYYSIAKAA